MNDAGPAPPPRTQIAPIPGDPSLAWSAGVWLAATRSPSSPSSWWVDAGTPATSLPWCPGEPNNKGGSESCTSLLTACTQGTAALVNDYPCGQQLRVLCALPAASDCAGASCGPRCVSQLILCCCGCLGA